MSAAPRHIIHLDMDAFYAAVEQHDFPELRGKPVIVGGDVRRGVVSAASYEARRFGIHSAMPMARALVLCPAAQVRKVRMERYREISAGIMAIFSRFTDRVEPLSIDEAFLDVTGCERLMGPPAAIAGNIRMAVREETGLTVSAGVAPNKFLAKLVSDSCKPDGLFVLLPEDVDRFLLPLPVRRLWGVGKVTADRLERLGLRTVGDLRGVGPQRLGRIMGNSGYQLYRLAHGEDDRPVESPEAIKSIGHEETFSFDLCDIEALHSELLDLAERVARRLRRKDIAGRCVTVKVKYADMRTATRSQTLNRNLDHAKDIYQEGVKLLGKTEAGCRPVRLLGLSVSDLLPRDSGQGDLFGEERRGRLAALDNATDLLHSRYGEKGIRRAALLGNRNSPCEKGDDPVD